MTIKITNLDVKYTVFNKESLPDISLPAICVIGRSNAGKSSFINTIVGRKKFAYTSSTPGKTRSLNFYIINNSFYIVDFPGYGYGAISDLTKKGWNDLIDSFFQKHQIKKYIFFLIDCRRKLDNLDIDLLDYLRMNNLPILYILTKIDKIPKSKISGIKSYFLQQFACEKSLVLPFSSLTKEGKEEVFDYIEKIIID